MHESTVIEMLSD